MLTLTGTLRQFGDISLGKDGDEKTDYLKLWLEHETPRKDGPSDLKIEELLIPKSDVGPEGKSLKAGSQVSVIVRAWAKGRDLSFAGVRLVNLPALASNASESH